MKRGKAPVFRLRPIDGGSSEPADVSLTFEEVYQKHVEFVWRCVRRLGVPEDCAEDVTQEVFVVVHRRLASFEGRSALTTWLYGIALGIVRNFRRTRQRKRWEQHEGLESAGNQPSTDEGPERAMARSQAIQTLHQILEQLSDKHREVFVLAELEKCTGEQIAKITDTKVSTVYARLTRAREEFEKLVQARHLGDEQ